MDNPGYIGVTRMNGLADELRAIANNIANSSTAGYRAEALVFAEVLAEADVEGGAIAMSAPRAHYTLETGGAMKATGGDLDLAIDGEGYFQVTTPDGPRLTRAGAFTLSPEGEVLTPDGHLLLDQGGAPVNIPPGSGKIAIGPDGAVSADGAPVAQIGLFAADAGKMLRQDGVLFRIDGDPEPAQGAKVVQGFIEGSNVRPMVEMSRLIEVQRAYEAGQSILDMEDNRLRKAVETLGRVG
ncbi:flagellar hook-basal body complex protein [Rubrimonas cliftonensis]|uniref:Flagellar basal-body rod protein FlgF n=1 Tax=Rubrimonas cliftonensis TaxID=89524 RepID=A0A1H4C707_9RHOB|nr:flagellar hook-basal body complex protein [Rubrimonas cliftonensis]SEA56093.1 flagellar basal-body rod protein FlgF [Rubrimonas cliftonensis]